MPFHECRVLGYYYFYTKARIFSYLNFQLIMSKEKEPYYPTGCDPEEGCQSLPAGIDRRDFLKASALGAAFAMVPGMPVFAGPFNENDYLKHIPADKKLDPEWVKSLFVRGEKEKYSDPVALSHIGMPVGGLFAGTVYLSGDGRLWLWDIFNKDQEGIRPKTIDYNGQTVRTRDGSNYVEPAEFYSPFQTGFELLVNDEVWPLNRETFEFVEFTGFYPMARVRYTDPGCPVEVYLEAFSPFIPGRVDDSSLPATIMSFRLVNKSNLELSCTVRGFVENPVCIDSADEHGGRRLNRIIHKKRITALHCEAITSKINTRSKRKDILFDDFERSTYSPWTVSGKAFGSGPVDQDEVPDYQGNLNIQGDRAVNSHSAAPGSDVGEKDAQIGKLVSPEFTLSRKYITCYIGGGAHSGKTCLQVIVEGELVASLTGRNANGMELSGINVAKWEGKTAHLELIDEVSGGWGNIGLDHIVFTDAAPASKPLDELRDFGSFCLASLNTKKDKGSAHEDHVELARSKSVKLSDPLMGEVKSTVELHPGGENYTDFALSWYFPNFYGRDFGGVKVGHHYAGRFKSAFDVANYIARNKDHLLGTTRKWVDTWYDSSLPYWLLDRTMANTSTLATTTCYRHRDGRFWAWEGIGCCTGTCTHVWHYAQAVGRLFPEIERDQRERVDFGMALKDNGEIGYRTLLDSSMGPAYDGQCGRIIGAYREHQMCKDDRFLQKNWPSIKKAIQYMLDRDPNLDGILEGSQPNTLDAAWFGKISFISSLYIAALRAGEAMALEMNDGGFASTCRIVAEKGAKNILNLYNGEFFIQEEDPEHKDVIGVGTGCYIDQIFGQTWAHWVGLGTLFDREKQLKALRSMYRYSFVPDVGPFRRHFKAGRWYAMKGDGGLLMCTWPKGGKRDKWEDQWQFMYFNECMSGFEWQAAAHMIFEGSDNPDILQNGLVVSRAIHDRYNAQLRNPYNEIECSDHYARAMASYGVFQAVCGFQYHGPKGMIEFDPRLTPDDFKSAFVTAAGWGSYAQKLVNGKHHNTLDLHFGELNIQEIRIRHNTEDHPQINLIIKGKVQDFESETSGRGLLAIKFKSKKIKAGQKIEIHIG